MGKKDQKQKHSKYNKTEQNTNTKYLGKSTRKQHPDTKAGRWGLKDGLTQEPIGDCFTNTTKNHPTSSDTSKIYNTTHYKKQP